MCTRGAIPPQVSVQGPCVIHGVAAWFDVFFNGTTNPLWLSTAPGQPVTHWYQIRCVLKTPLYVLGPCQLNGSLRLVAHNRQSYTVHVQLQAPSFSTDQSPPVPQMVGNNILENHLFLVNYCTLYVTD